MSELLYILCFWVTMPSLFLPSLTIFAIDNFTNNLTDESFYLPFLVVWVLYYYCSWNLIDSCSNFYLIFVFQLLSFSTFKPTIQSKNTNRIYCGFVWPSSWLYCCVAVCCRYDRFFDWIVLVVHFVHRWHCNQNVLLEIWRNIRYWDATKGNKGTFLRYGTALCGCKTVTFEMFSSSHFIHHPLTIICFSLNQAHRKIQQL